MRFPFRNRLFIALALISCAVLPKTGIAQQPLPFQSWDELAAHAGLADIKPKAKNQFRVDAVIVSARNASVIKAAIMLTAEEWERLNSSIPNHLLHPWMSGPVDTNTWKSTVDLILPFNGTVNVDRLKPDDKAAIVRRPDLRTTRLYMLSPNADGRTGVLYYFYTIY